MESDEYGGFNPTDNDGPIVPGNYIPAQQTQTIPLWILGWFRNPAFVGCNGGVLSPMAVFLPQSNIFLSLGKGS